MQVCCGSLRPNKRNRAKAPECRTGLCAVAVAFYPWKLGSLVYLVSFGVSTKDELFVCFFICITAGSYTPESEPPDIPAEGDAADNGADDVSSTPALMATGALSPSSGAGATAEAESPQATVACITSAGVGFICRAQESQPEKTKCARGCPFICWSRALQSGADSAPPPPPPPPPLSSG